MEVTFFAQEDNPGTHNEEPWNLHAVWDSGMIDHTGLQYDKYIHKLETKLQSGGKLGELQRGTPLDWALEAHQAAIDHWYGKSRGLDLGEEYYQESLPVVDDMLTKAGVRLAKLLTDALKPR